MPLRERVRALADVGARLAAGDDVVLADGVEDPARVGDQLVVRQRDAAPQRRTSAATGGIAQRARRARCGIRSCRRACCAASRGSASSRPSAAPNANSATAPAIHTRRSQPGSSIHQPPRKTAQNSSSTVAAAEQVAVDHRGAGDPLGEEHEVQQRRRRQRHDHAPRGDPHRERRCPASAPSITGSLSIRSVNVHIEEITLPRTPACVRVPGPGRRSRSASRTGCR